MVVTGFRTGAPIVGILYCNHLTPRTAQRQSAALAIVNLITWNRIVEMDQGIDQGNYKKIPNTIYYIIFVGIVGGGCKISTISIISYRWFYKWL